MLRKPLLAVAALAFGPLFFAPAFAADVDFHGTLSGSAEVPPTTGSGTGDVLATLDTTTRMLSYTLTFEELSGPATAAHFHGPAAAGVNAGVLVPLTPPIVSPYHGTATLTDDQVKELMAGKFYANVHTAANPGGEIRAQILTGNMSAHDKAMMHKPMKSEMSDHEMPDTKAK